MTKANKELTAKLGESEARRMENLLEEADTSKVNHQNANVRRGRKLYLVGLILMLFFSRHTYNDDANG